MSAHQFGRIPTWIVTTGVLATLKPAARGVLLALCARADRSFVAFPGLPTLQADTGMTRQGVLNGIADLEAAGIVQVHRNSKPGRSHVNHYLIKSQPPLTLSTKSTTTKESTAVAERVNGGCKKSQPPLTRTDLNRQNRPFASKAKAGKTPEQALREKVRKQLSGANNEQR